MGYKKYVTLVILLCKILFVLLLAVFMIIYPQIVFNAAIRGLDTWWRIVFPALLPFFVISEILMGLGLVHFLGVILEPIMRPLFNLPGTSAFVVAVGYTSGAPIGAVLTSKLRKENLCTRIEAARLMAFTNNASPLFMFGAIAVGMFNNAAVGIVIAGAHYLSNLCVGLLLRFYGKDQDSKFKTRDKNQGLLSNAIRSMYRAYIADGRPIGKLLGDAIKDSVQTLLTIGGFIIIFSVIIEVCTTIGLLESLASSLALVLSSLDLGKELYHALSCGLIEMTIGAKITSETTAPLEQQILVVSIILGWLGLSVHAQAISMVADTDIDIKPYIFARVVHSILAAIWVTILLKFPIPTLVSNSRYSMIWKNPWLQSLYSLQFAGFILCIMIVISLCIVAAKYISHLRKYFFSQMRIKK